MTSGLHTGAGAGVETAAAVELPPPDLQPYKDIFIDFKMKKNKVLKKCLEHSKHCLDLYPTDNDCKNDYFTGKIK